MTTMKEQFTYVCGPYKGYYGKAEYDADDKEFFGTMVGTRDVVTFVSRSPDKLGKEFQASVDDYLEFCASRGEKPEKPHSGKFVARLEPKLHQQLSVMAELSGVSLNQLVEKALERIVGEVPSIQTSAGTVRRKHTNISTTAERTKPKKGSTIKMDAPRQKKREESGLKRRRPTG